MSALEDAAIAYVEACIAQEGADTAGLLAACAQVDLAWHDLLIASGRCTCEVTE